MGGRETWQLQVQSLSKSVPQQRYIGGGAWKIPSRAPLRAEPTTSHKPSNEIDACAGAFVFASTEL